MKKCAKLLQIIDSKKLHIIFGTETWLSKSITNNEIIPDNMSSKIYRIDRENGHGGIMIAVYKCVRSIRLPKFWHLMKIL